MDNKVEMAFEPNIIFVEFDDIIPTRRLPKRVKITTRYLRVSASIREIGIIEPPVVARDLQRDGKFLLLDGHLRMEALKNLGNRGVSCLVSTGDEAFTYNKRINRLATVQEYKMILKTVERGVSEERIAAALGIDVEAIRRKQSLLRGVCHEAAELLKDKQCSITTLRALKKMTSERQVEVAELMIMMNNYTISYANALLAATPKSQLVKPKISKNFKSISAEQMVQMEFEMAKLQREMKLIEDSYGLDHLSLVLARGYLVTLIENEQVSQYLAHNHNEILCEFRRISEVVSMGSEETR